VLRAVEINPASNSILTVRAGIGSVIIMRKIFTISLWLWGALLVQAAEEVPDFRLQDMNSRSNRKGGLVSPRDYLMQVSGYYFGAAH